MLPVRSLLFAAAAACPATLIAADYKFEAPQRVTAAGKNIEVEQPGYAFPCMFDIDGDGMQDLLVGQFNDGKIAVYKGIKTADGKRDYAERQWLQAGGEDVVVPGVW